MLQRLYIKNYALIEQLEIYLSENLNIITGETGAGKSIILGALSLILGERANLSALKNNKAKCIVEGSFLIDAYQLQSFFDKHELDYESETVIRREISKSGKSRAFINDSPVHLTVLKVLGEQLINLHAQHQTLQLHEASYHLQLIDALAKHETTLTQYHQLFTQWNSNKNALKKQEATFAKLERDLDYIQFQLNELEEAQLLDKHELIPLEEELNQLSNAEQIKQVLAQSVAQIDDDQFGVLQNLESVRKELNDIAKFGSSFEALTNRLESLCIELQDVNNELVILEEEVTMDPDRLTLVNERINLLYRLLKKHQVDSIAELVDIRDKLTEQSNTLGNSDEVLKQLRELIQKQESELSKLAASITQNRQAQFAVFENKVNALLKEVGMPNATVKMQHTLLKEFSENGTDEISLYFAGNKGMPHDELRKVASGGELSRLMLCIQSLMASKTALPTLIFDEIDTGISGEVGLKVGKVMQKLAAHHQVICITHLPQIASKGNTHFFVYKHDTEERTVSNIKILNKEERVVEIAKMLSGDSPGKMAIANAEELLTH